MEELSDDKVFARLSLVSGDIPLSCVWRFRESIPNGHRTKMGYIVLIKEDLAQLSAENLLPTLRVADRWIFSTSVAVDLSVYSREIWDRDRLLSVVFTEPLEPLPSG